MNSSIQIRLGLTGLSQVTTGLNQLSAGIARFAAPLVGLASAGVALNKFADGLKDAVAEGGRMHDMAARTGAAIRNLAVQQLALKDAGGTTEGLATAYSRLQQSIDAAGTAGSAQAFAFEKIGLSVESLAAMKPDEQFERVAKAIGSLPGPTERTAAAMGIFGKAGADLLPLFRDGGALDDARRTLGQLPQVLARNADNLDAIGDNLGHLAVKSRQFFVGMLDPLSETLRGWTDKINAIDLTGFGQRIGAAVKLAIDSWNDGKFSEFIGLSIQAGFELGRIGIEKALRAMDWQHFWGPLANGLATAMAEAFKISLMFGAPGLSGAIGSATDGILSKFRGALGLNKGLDTSALDELMRRLQAIVEASNSRTGESASEGEAGSVRKKLDLLGLEKDLKEQLAYLDDYRRQSDGDFAMTDAKKFERRKTSLLAEIKLLDDKLKLLTQEAALENDPERRSKLLGSADNIRDKIRGTQGRLDSMGADPQSIRENFTATITDVSNRLGTFAQQTSRAFGSVIGSAVDGIAGSIKGLLNLTMSWGDALRNIGTSILTGVINAIAQMFAEWIVQMTIVRGLKRLFHVEDTAQAIGTTAAWAPAAATTNAATGGATASIGVPLTLALILAAVGTIAALAFEHGGYTPGGPTLAMVGERGPEFVIPADATRRLGPQNLAMIHQGVVPSGGGSGGGSSVQINMGVFDDKQRMEDFMRSSQGRKIFVDLAKQHAREITR